MYFSPLFLFSADDIWLLPLSGRLPLRVYTVAPQGDSGLVATLHSAMLWPQVCISISIRVTY